MSLEQKILQKLGENIRRERVRRKLTQERLAELAETDITNLQRIEAGRYNTKVLTLMRIRDALEVDWEVIIPDR